MTIRRLRVLAPYQPIPAARVPIITIAATCTRAIRSNLYAPTRSTSCRGGDRGAFQRNLLATIGLGLVFVAGVALEWSTADFELSDPFGTAFFSMTGVHAAHVVSGIVMLGLLYSLSLRGHFSAKKHWGVEATVKYWHFVDVVWVFFYPILYLISS